MVNVLLLFLLRFTYCREERRVLLLLPVCSKKRKKKAANETNISRVRVFVGLVLVGPSTMFGVCRLRLAISPGTAALATKRGGDVAYAIAVAHASTVSPDTGVYWDRLYSLGMQPWMQEVRANFVGLTQAPPSSPSPIQVLEDLTVSGNNGKGVHLADKHCALLLHMLLSAFRSLSVAAPRDQRLIEDEVLSVTKEVMKGFHRHHEIGAETVMQHVRLMSYCASFAHALHAVPGVLGRRMLLHVVPTTAHFNVAFRVLLRRPPAFPARVRVGLDSMLTQDVAPDATTLIVLHSVYARNGRLACILPSLRAALGDEAPWVQQAVRSPWYYYCVGMALEEHDERAEWVQDMRTRGVPPLPPPLSALYVAALPLSDALRTAHGALDAVEDRASFDEFLKSDPTVCEDDLWCYTGEAEPARVRAHLAAQIMRAALEKSELSPEQRYEEYLKFAKRASDLTAKAVKVQRFVADSLVTEFRRKAGALRAGGEDSVSNRRVVAELEGLLAKVVSMNSKAKDRACIAMRKQLFALKRASVATSDASRA